MRINIHAGHNPDGKAACGAVGFLRESSEARRVKDEVISQLRQLGHTVYDCTCESGTCQADVLGRIVTACNAHTVDLDVSIHFNSGIGDVTGDGRTTGTEVFVYSSASKAKGYAENVCRAVAGLGFRNRGVKYNKSLYVLKKTKAPAMLIECCFVDDRDDVQLYHCQKMASAIVLGLTGKAVVSEPEQFLDVEAAVPGAETQVGNNNKIYRVQVIEQQGAFSVKENAEKLQKQLIAAGFDAIITAS